LEYGQRSLAISRELGLKEQMGYTLTNLLMVYLNHEELSAARETGREARKIWLELGNTPMLADGYNTALWIEIIAGKYDAALSMGREGKRLGQSIGSVWGQAGALNSMAVAYLEKAEIERAMRSMREARRLAKEADMQPLIFFSLPYLTLAELTVGNFEQADRYANQLYDERDSLIHVYRPMSLAVCAEVKIRLGQLDMAQRILAEANEGLELDGPLFGLTRLLLTNAYLQLALDNPRRGLEHIEYMVGRMRQTAVHHYLPEGLFLQGKILSALDEPESARDAFLEARKVAEDTGVRRYLWQILWELSQLETATGNASNAGRYRRQAQGIVATIADQTGSEELRTSFLSLPEVQSVLAK
jgi:tetratricopeptide (TPR) repeat protein